jgi:hypothetical protein
MRVFVFYCLDVCFLSHFVVNMLKDNVTEILVDRETESIKLSPLKFIAQKRPKNAPLSKKSHKI